MLIDEIIDFCDGHYSSQDTKCSCSDCNHQNSCSGSCKQCLEEIHYPNKYPLGKKDYDCCNLMNFYVCDYTHKYASEMLYLLRESEALKEIKNYHIMSIGCGGAPDLIAFERYIMDSGIDKTISYWGIDKNKLWQPIHDVISEYRNSIIGKAQFDYADAIQLFNQHSVKSTNVLILQYIISHFYNTNQIAIIDSFYDDLIKNIIKHKEDGVPFVILINDVNSNNRGRDYFIDLCEKLSQSNLTGTYSQFYFNYRIQNDHQKYGTMHQQNELLFKVPNKLNKYEPWRVCSSAQMLIELK